eukprot:CAMPEP_0185913252 /NCGR_PEP_ID=MMETSP0196C-20130402/42989_1 /TAXON_ID=2932 /ORGANISM="Alexandrium fundyense, Strain CCMP1719" /LENGTH=279 /DNA_ID=CAMNT_0028634591 /DNA_START=278 /DNA_END=1118 /DNA_ORIENTATION=-
MGAPWVRSATVLESVTNPVKTVADTIADFYAICLLQVLNSDLRLAIGAQPPELPVFPDICQLHLVTVDSRFKYDVVFALGIKEYFTGLMGTYDKLVASQQSEKIWNAMITALGLEPDKVTADAETVSAYASSTSPADILKHMEGPADATDASVGQAFESIGSSLYSVSWSIGLFKIMGIESSLYSVSFSIGLFKIMELSGVEVTKANVEEWAKALKIAPAKVTSDLETYKLNKNKLQQAEEMIREVEIREKKKLAERLEAKAKALAEKAAQKSAKAEDK